ncbi:hypothetical protein BCR36DRAFT_375766 [Piromyces finnis]|uniref:MFS general substrate transporter n=1 Tax=Piromyces finnis TaxID=1754191 RepID=A0A1Y1UDT7_9FUNG|nr:hypothetical protein BCR36DRAFT_375766 [Piromyces finnis]|eukprot:ORX36201.1 hypothetical protein BCR36DRAFT_375766 [Piromyces finnis]
MNTKMFNSKKDGNELKYTVDQAFYQIGYGPFQQNMAMLSCAGIGLGSYQIISFIINLPKIKEAISSTNDNFIWVNPIIGLFLSQIIGGFYWTYIGNKYGRKKASIYSVFLNLVNNISFFFLPTSTVWLNIHAIVLGFSIGTNISTDIQCLMILHYVKKSNHPI